MSRIGKSPVNIPSGVTVNIDSGLLTVKGAKGELKVPYHKSLTIKQQDNTLVVERPNDKPEMRAQHGLARSLIANAVEGVSNGYTIKLELKGLGFRAKMSGSSLELSLGFSHPVMVAPPEGVTFATPEITRIDVMGIDKQLVGQVAANIRRLRKPDAYHGKGVRFLGQNIPLKPGKKAGAK